MALDRTKKKFTMATPNTQTLGELLGELGELLPVSRRSDGKYYLSDMCQSPNINRWAKYKPFRNSAWNFASDTERNAARKAANQGLLLPTPKNAGVSSQHAYGYRYLGYLAYLIMSGAIESYPYLQPRGVTSVYTEPNRLRDLDGYDKTAIQPFTTGATLIYADGRQKQYQDGMELNRFEVKSVRLWVQMGNGNVQISLADLLYGTNGTQFYLTGEQYKKVTGIDTEFFSRVPDVVKHSTKHIAQIPINNGFDSVDFELAAEDDNTKWYGVVGINKFTQASDTIPANEGAGFVAPWTSTNKPFLFTFNQNYHGVLEGALYQGYYRAGTSASWTAFNIPDRTQKNTASDSVGLSIKLKRMNANYYIVNQNGVTGVPSGSITYMFKMILAAQTTREIIGKVATSTLADTGNGHIAITTGGGAEQVAYLRFDGILAVGDYLQNGILMVSNDNGKTWTYVESPSTGGWSSVAMYVKRTT